MKLPLSLQLIIAVALAVLVALLAPDFFRDRGDIGLVVIRLLKVVAAPLLFLAIVDAFWNADIPASSGAKLFVLSGVNAVVATLIGLGVAHVVGGGKHWVGQVDALTQQAHASSLPAVADTKASVASFVPAHILEPFMGQNVLSVVAVAVIVGIALRRAKKTNPEGTGAIARVVSGGLSVCSQVLHWLVAVVPIAVFFVVASVVAQKGVAVFALLGWFVITVLLGMLLHAGAYYAVLCVTLARRSPRQFFAGAADAIVTALSCGSSLATLPVTLRCLDEKLKVKPEASRLAACVGTNLNHDGIILYEAATAIFVAQALGWDLSLSQQLVIAGASVMAGVGIAGVPEAGLITLPLVLAAAGVDERVVASIVPLLFTVDWFIGRLRAAVNVTSDMIVACILDRGTA